MTDAEKEMIRFLRMEGLGYGAVAERLGLSENTVKSYCRRNHLTGVAAKERAKVCRECGVPLASVPGRKGAEILQRGLSEGMVAVASGAGTPGGVLCAGLRALRAGISELWK